MLPNRTFKENYLPSFPSSSKTEQEDRPPNSCYDVSTYRYKAGLERSKQRKLQAVSLVRTEAQSLVRAQARQIPARLTRTECSGLGDASLGSKDGSTYTKQWDTAHSLKQKNHVIISVDAERTVDRIQQPFTVRS